MMRAALVAFILVISSPVSALACAADIQRWRAIFDVDVRTGHLNRQVHQRIMADLAAIERTCAAGNATQATRDLAALRQRNGYR